MLIGSAEEMQDSDVACLADWADHHAKVLPHPTWKRAYALIREGCDLLLRRRAMNIDKEENVALSQVSHPLKSRTVNSRGM
jgi:hypothetical protein